MIWLLDPTFLYYSSTVLLLKVNTIHHESVKHQWDWIFLIKMIICSRAKFIISAIKVHHSQQLHSPALVGPYDLSVGFQSETPHPYPPALAQKPHASCPAMVSALTRPPHVLRYISLATNLGCRHSQPQASVKRKNSHKRGRKLWQQAACHNKEMTRAHTFTVHRKN